MSLKETAVELIFGTAVFKELQINDCHKKRPQENRNKGIPKRY